MIILEFMTGSTFLESSLQIKHIGKILCINSQKSKPIAQEKRIKYG
jgi:hypothetical protein